MRVLSEFRAEPPLRIIDEHERDVGDRYYKSGSTVDLQCQISRNFFQKERHNILKSTESGGSANKLNETGSELNLIGDANQTYSTFSSQELEKYFTNFITWAKDEEPLPALTNRRSRHASNRIQCAIFHSFICFAAYPINGSIVEFPYQTPNSPIVAIIPVHLVDYLL